MTRDRDRASYRAVDALSHQTNPEETLVRTVLSAIGMAIFVTVCAGSARADSEAARTVSTDELAALAAKPDGPLMLDVRTPAEFAAGHIPGAVNVPIDELGGRLATLSQARERGVVVYCERGVRAGKAAAQLRSAGIPAVRELDGSLARWRSEDRPIDAPSGGL